MKAVFIVFFLFVTGCNTEQETETGALSSVQEVVDTIRQEAESISQNPDITDNIDLIREEQSLIVSDVTEADMEVSADPSNITVIPTESTDFPQTPRYVSKKDIDSYHKTDEIPKTSSPISMSKGSKINVWDSHSYIKIGQDKSGIIVTTKKAEKITVVVQTKYHIPLVDVYIYAIPVDSPLVRNYNTLLGFINNLEVINKQAQFTRFWNGRRSNRTWFKKGKYNIYVEYRYKNKNGNIIGLEGRYWGGSRRNWTITFR